jgi:prepilin-type N-terminal cleavage/methylation domain-containing protein
MPTISAQKHQQRRSFLRGLSLIELLIVVAIIGLVVLPLLVTYASHRTTQALYSSSDQVANHTRSVRIFSREAREQKEWGIKNVSENSYALYSTGASGLQIVQNYSLERGVSFTDDFDIRFEIGTGETEQEHIIGLQSSNDQSSSIFVSTTGVVEVKN